jgi:serine protease Do
MSQPGEQVEIDIWHQGSRRKLQVQLGDATAPVVKPQTAKTTDTNPVERLGLLLGSHRSGENSKSDHDVGLLIQAVNGAAERAGVQPGDLLLAIDGIMVGTFDQANAAANQSGKSVALLLQREGMKIYVPLRLV